MCACGRDRRGSKTSNSNVRAQRTFGCRASSSRNPSHAVQILVRVLARGKESPHLSREEHSDDGNTSGSIVATAVQKKGHDKFCGTLPHKESRVIPNDWRDGAPDGQRNGPIDVAKHVAAEKRRPSSDRLPRKAANQTRTLNKHTKVSKPWSEP